MVMEIIVSVILLFVGIIVLIVIHVCVVGRVFRVESTNVASSIPSQLDSAPSMSPEDIKKLPCFDYDEKGSANMSSVECAVCLESFNGGEKCRILPKCNHVFHGVCIDSWLMKTGACPVCRSDAQFEESTSTCSGDVGIELF